VKILARQDPDQFTVTQGSINIFKLTSCGIKTITKWYEYIGDATLADAIIDSIISNANKIKLKGESMRLKKKK
jgi:DNA replication protein DnaC